MTQTLARKLKFRGLWTGGMGSMIGLSDPGADSGKFSMLIELNSDGTFHGTTMDKHGKATIEGILTNTEINFTKEYLPGEPGARVGKIIYKDGKRDYDNPKEFRGIWRFSRPSYNRIFKLRVVG